MVKTFCTPVSGQGGVPMDPNSEKYFPEWIWRWRIKLVYLKLSSFSWIWFLFITKRTVDCKRFCLIIDLSIIKYIFFKCSTKGASKYILKKSMSEHIKSNFWVDKGQRIMNGLACYYSTMFLLIKVLCTKYSSCDGEMSIFSKAQNTKRIYIYSGCKVIVETLH